MRLCQALLLARAGSPFARGQEAVVGHVDGRGDGFGGDVALQGRASQGRVFVKKVVYGRPALDHGRFGGDLCISNQSYSFELARC